MNNYQAEMLVFVDLVLFSLQNNELCVALQKREVPHFENKYAITGSLIRKEDEDDQGALTRAYEKLNIKPCYTEALGWKACRMKNGSPVDPRGKSSSLIFMGIVGQDHEVPETKDWLWMPIDQIKEDDLGFDHYEMIQMAYERLKSKVNYSSLAAYFLHQKFTLTELQQTYEILLGHKIEKSFFRKTLQKMNWFEAVNDWKVGAFRPAQLYVIKNREIQFKDKNWIK